MRNACSGAVSRAVRRAAAPPKPVSIFGLAPEHASITDFKPPALAGKLRDVDVTVGGPSQRVVSRRQE